MPDSQNITQNLLEMYGRDDWIMRANFRCFLRLSGLDALDRQVRVLDCGCGMGHLMRALNQAGFKYLTGLDASEEMVAAARSLTGRPVLHADVVNLKDQASAGSFDVVIVSDLVHHLETMSQWLNLLAGCAQVLVPNGLLIIREPHPTILIRVLYGLSKVSWLRVGFLKPRLQSFVEEDSLLKYFFTHWSPSYPRLLASQGLLVEKDLTWLVHRITVCRRVKEPACGPFTI